jgi:hypothetical protein
MAHIGSVQSRTERNSMSDLLGTPLVLIASMDGERRKQIAEQVARDGFRISESNLAIDADTPSGQSAPSGERTPSGESVLRRLRQQSTHEPRAVDLLILDLTGLVDRARELLQAIREIDSRLDLILISTEENAAVERVARHVGARGLFIVPFEVDDLRTLVVNLAPSSPEKRGRN